MIRVINASSHPRPPTAVGAPANIAASPTGKHKPAPLRPISTARGPNPALASLPTQGANAQSHQKAQFEHAPDAITATRPAKVLTQTDLKALIADRLRMNAVETNHLQSLVVSETEKSRDPGETRPCMNWQLFFAYIEEYKVLRNKEKKCVNDNDIRAHMQEFNDFTKRWKPFVASANAYMGQQWKKS